MKTFIGKHLELVLIAATVVLVGAMAFCFTWSIVFASQNLNAVFQFKSAAPQSSGFNIAGAQQLNLRGLVQ